MDGLPQRNLPTQPAYQPSISSDKFHELKETYAKRSTNTSSYHATAYARQDRSPNIRASLILYFSEGEARSQIGAMVMYSVTAYLMSDSKTKLHGTVESIGYGVTPDPDVVGKLAAGLPDVQRTLNWVRLASRYPVRIRIIDPPPSVLRVGQVANVIVR
jgi:hypothetical protein